ncbi:MAG: TVP38/TMEM64 family protein [Clostridiaceae bacterium]|nr:TVP38/TMEM64 family protein [Clostridiaceae bacterium]
MLNSFGWKGILIFIGFQVFQVVVAAIPGEFVQIAGGYVYGTFAGTLYSLAGIVTGSVLVFTIARLIGYPVVKLFVTPKQLEKFSFMMNSDKSEAAMFILFLIPGIPKDILTYIAGLTPVKPFRFFVIITIGRLPALLGSSFIGHSTQKGDYGIAIIVSTIAVVLFAGGLIFRNRIIDWTNRLIKK